MSAEKKVELILSVKNEYGLAPVLRALDLPRSTWYYHEKQKISYQQKYAHIRPILEDVLREHPFPAFARTCLWHSPDNARVE